MIFLYDDFLSHLSHYNKLSQLQKHTKEMLPSLRFEMHVIEKRPLANFDPKTVGTFGSRPKPGNPV